MAGNVITVATYKATMDASNFKTEAQSMKASADEVTQSVGRMDETTQKAGRNASNSSSGFDRFLASIDKNVRMAQAYQRDMEKLERFQESGAASAAEYAIAEDRIREKYAALSGEQDKATAGMDRFGHSANVARELLGALGVTLSIAGLIEFGKRVVESTASLGEQADQVGVSTDALQAYRAVFMQTNITQEEGDRIIARLTQSIGEATQAAGKQRDAFVHLGISARDLAGGAGSALPLIAQRLLEIEDASARATVETDLFGKAGQKLESALRQLQDPMDEIIERGKRYGYVLDEDLIKKSNDASNKIGAAWWELKNKLTPTFVWIQEQLAEFIHGFALTAESITSLVNGIPNPRINNSAKPYPTIESQKSLYDSGQLSTNGSAWQTQADMAAARQKELEAARDIAETQKGLNQDIQQATAYVERQNDALFRQQLAYVQYQTSLQEDLRLAGLSREQREAELAVIEGRNRAAAAGVDFDEQAVREIVAQRQAAEKLRDVADDLQNGFQDFFENVLSGGKDAFSKLGDWLKNYWKRLIAEMAAQTLTNNLNGLFGGIFGGGGTSTLGSILGLGSGSGFGSGGLLSGLGNIFGLGSGGLLTNQAGLAIARGDFVSSGGLFGGTGLFSGSLGNIFGSGFSGLGVGSIVGSLIGGNSSGSSIGGALGGAIGSIIPGVGTLIGSILGSVAGSLFGGKPSNFGAWSTFGDNYSSYSVSPNGANSSTMSAAAQADAAIIKAAQSLEAVGLQLPKINSIVIGQRDPSQLYTETNGRPTILGAAGDVQAAVKGTIDFLIGGATGADETTQKILDYYKNNGGLTVDNLDQFSSDVQFAKSLENLDFTQKKLTDAEQLLADVSAQFDEVSKRAQQLGLDQSNVVLAQQKAIADIVNAYNDDTQHYIDMATNPLMTGWLDLIKMQQDRIEEVKALGADITLLEKRNEIERQAYLNTLLDPLKQFETSLLGGNLSILSPQDQYASLKSAFESLSASAAGGDLNALTQIASAAQAFLDASRKVNASNTTYAGDFSEVLAAIKALKDTVSSLDATLAESNTQALVSG